MTYQQAVQLFIRNLREYGIFWNKSAPEGPILLSNFYKIWHGEGLPRPYNHANFHLCGFKMWPYGRQNAKSCNFGYKFSPKKKFRGSIEKLEYRCTTRNPFLCNGTIIVLKITLLHSVSIITNFVIPKCDKKTNKKNITLFRLQPARDTRSPPYLAW